MCAGSANPSGIGTTKRCEGKPGRRNVVSPSGPRLVESLDERHSSDIEVVDLLDQRCIVILRAVGARADRIGETIALLTTQGKIPRRMATALLRYK